MLNGRAHDVMNHKWFDGVAWAELEARRVTPPRKPRESDSAKRLKVRAAMRAGGNRKGKAIRRDCASNEGAASIQPL